MFSNCYVWKDRHASVVCTVLQLFFENETQTTNRHLSEWFHLLWRMNNTSATRIHWPGAAAAYRPQVEKLHLRIRKTEMDEKREARSPQLQVRLRGLQEPEANVAEFTSMSSDGAVLQEQPNVRVNFQISNNWISRLSVKILSQYWVTVDEVSIGNWIDWTLPHRNIASTSNYCATSNSHTLQFTTARTVFSVCRIFTYLCLVTASNGGRSLYSGFPNYPRASATSLYQQQLTRTDLQQSSNSLTRSTSLSATTLTQS
jgi:hypothetical protein